LPVVVVVQAGFCVGIGCGLLSGDRVSGGLASGVWCLVAWWPGRLATFSINRRAGVAALLIARKAAVLHSQ
jgi:hypothetical protein